MNVQTLNVSKEAALDALTQYKSNRGVYDKRDWEIERIYRQIARGKTVISVHDAIRNAGIDSIGRPKLAIMRADQEHVRCHAWTTTVTFTSAGTSHASDQHFEIAWPGRSPHHQNRLAALLPRIPPQHRPSKNLSAYHILWEADWREIPRDPYLLKRIGKDAWVVLAAWELTDIEMSVLRAHRPQ